MRWLLPTGEFAGLEINATAAAEAERAGFSVLRRSLLGYRSELRFDFVLISGVLIHIDPTHLEDAYDALYSACGRYLCIAEYYNPEPTEIPYRGHRDRLFKRDFAGEVLDRFGDLRLVDYGFVYHRANQFPGDDFTWFLLERA
jgi:pseudaminic acid biosynthesis-associated methylase